MPRNIQKKYRLALKVALIVGIVIFLKLIAHWFRWEIISLNPLFSGIVAANVFLMGFLLSGVLGDYKESERLPGELTTSIDSIIEEARTIYKNKNAPVAKECITYLNHLTVSIKNWFYKKERTSDIMDQLSGPSIRAPNAKLIKNACDRLITGMRYFDGRFDFPGVIRTQHCGKLIHGLVQLISS